MDDAPAPEPTIQAVLATLDRLRQHITDTTAETRRYIDAGLAATRVQIAELRQHLDEDGAHTRQVIEQRTAEIGRYLDVRLAEERRHGDERHDETRRHMGVLGESLMTKIELVADGGRTNAAQLERFQAETRDQFAHVDRRLMRLVASRPRRRRP